MTTQTAHPAATTDSKLLQTAAAFVGGYNAWSISAILAPRAPNCTQQVLPYSLHRPVLDNDAYRDMFSGIMPLFQRFTVEVLETVVDEANCKVALHARSTAETPLGPYGNEYMIVLRMTDDHAQIVQVKEFVDSAYSDDFFKRLRKWKEENPLNEGGKAEAS